MRRDFVPRQGSKTELAGASEAFSDDGLGQNACLLKVPIFREACRMDQAICGSYFLSITQHTFRTDFPLGE